MLKTQLERKIKVFQCDGGGEFARTKFRDHIQGNGILLHISCPATPEQNSVAERKHRHVVELGLAMMFHASTPTRYWVEAFGTAVFIINRPPSTVLDLDTPLHTLPGKSPDYTMLRVFGCQCIPCLRPYVKNKLEPRSLECIFLGYSEFHKGYRWMDISTGRIYVS
ncbi:hypothetical protein NE237_009540 [Protea cynaroides]|uniref:Integrase catalytic domain-containing protein n=1 Tax=Protea cynaroides TaxID=273540 RepID=A0A9Q0R0D8_9MAGN|nr:hypothetical protein NE237_009540 [Protea cynaroides]